MNMMLGQMGAEVDETQLLDTQQAKDEADAKFGVMSTPTLILFDDEGNELSRTVGIHPPSISGILAQAGKL
jgi:thioredoxin-related protein